jgi:DHA3 family macrolide efflux protein-like MFS transporter
MENLTTKKTFRHYLFFLFGQQFSLLGSMIVGFVITWWLTIKTGSPIILSLSVFLMFIPQIIITPLSGVIADRWNRKILIAISDSFQALLTFLLFIIFLFDISSVWFVLTINTFRAAGFAFQLPATSAIIPVMVPKERLSRINGVNFLFSGMIYSLGPIIGAVLFEIFPIDKICLIDILTFILALIPLLIIKIPSVCRIENKVIKRSFLKDFKKGFSMIRAIPGLFAMIILAMIWNFINRPFAVLLPYFVKFVHNGTVFNLAMIMMSFQLANIIGAAFTSIKKDIKNKIKINIIGASVFFFGQLFFVFAPKGDFLFMIIGSFPGAILLPITISTYLAILQSAVPKEATGRIMSIDHMISMAIAPIGAIIAGPLAEILGVQFLFYICALLGITFPILIWLLTKIRCLDYREEVIIEEKTKEYLEIPKIPELTETIE